MSDISPTVQPSRAIFTLAGIAAVLGVLLLGWGVWRFTSQRPAPEVTARPTNTLLLATRDMARLETTEMHVEKVIDLTDTQSRLYGLVEGTDNVLLVAVGDVSLGVDLGKLEDGDVTLDPQTHAAHFRLPQPEVFSARLDENATYVYRRETSVFAKRNEQLESKARQEAQNTIQKQADSEDAKARARGQAEKVLRQLATSLGASSVTFDWK